MRILLALLIIGFLHAPAFAAEPAWAFSTRLSSAGPLCVASVEQHGVTTGFYGLPLGPTYGFVRGVNLPRNARSTWQVGGYEWRQFVGAVDSNNGFHFYPGITRQLLHEVAVGSRLDLYLHDHYLAGNAPLMGTLDISLRGSSRAIASLLKCQAGHHQPVYRAMVVVEAYWYVMPLHASQY